MKTQLKKALLTSYISRALIFFIYLSLFVCLICCWYSGAIDWQQVEKIRLSDKSDIYSILVVIEMLTFIIMIKQKASNNLLYIKEIVEIIAVIILLILHVYDIIQTAIGLYTEVIMCTLFCLMNVGVIFISLSKHDTSRL